MYTLVIWVHSVTDGDDVYRLEGGIKEFQGFEGTYLVDLKLKISYQCFTNNQCVAIVGITAKPYILQKIQYK